jgi:hypothetical protein
MTWTDRSNRVLAKAIALKDSFEEAAALERLCGNTKKAERDEWFARQALPAAKRYVKSFTDQNAELSR